MTSNNNMMAEDDNISDGFPVGCEDHVGEINRAFETDENLRANGTLHVSLEDDGESDYYTGSPVDSLNIGDHEPDRIPEAERGGFERSTDRQYFKSRSLFKQHIQNLRKKLESKQKWRDLTMGTSFVYAMCMAIIFLSLQFSDILPAKTITDITILSFLVVMFSVSILAIGFLLTMCALGMLTSDDHYKKRGKSTFIRGGMLVLGTGIIIYACMTIATYALQESECQKPIVLVFSILEIVFFIGQIAFLLIYNKIRINKSLFLSILGRYLLMQIIATNLCIWLKVVFHETLEEIEIQNDKVGKSWDTPNGKSFKSSFHQTIDFEKRIIQQEGASNVTCNANNTEMEITHILTPYLFPLIIEFCVMASCMCLAVWENCGNGWLKAQITASQDDAISNKASTSSDVFTITEPSQSSAGHSPRIGANHQPSHYFNNNIGFVFGWVVIVGTVVVVIILLYFIYSGKNDSIIEPMMYSINLVLSAICLVVIPLTMYSMSRLTFKDDEIRALRVHHHDHHGLTAPSAYKGIHRRTDKSLLFNTYIAMMTFKFFVMIASFEMDQPVIFIDGIISILFGFTQTLFINWYALQKRAATEEDRKEKPGRQGLEFLRCTNFALWLVNTFLLKNPKAKRTMYDSFGYEAWAILSNILQPLTILYYFHSMVCLAEVIGHSYTAKYVGVSRPWKKPKTRKKKTSLKAISTFIPEPEFTSF